MSAGIDNSPKRLERRVIGKCLGVTGDTGGESAIQHIIKDLTVRDTVLKWAKHTRYILHALHKCFKRAIKASMGKQGFGTNSCIQLLYSSITISRKIIVEGGLKLYDNYHNIVVNAIMENLL